MHLRTVLGPLLLGTALLAAAPAAAGPARLKETLVRLYADSDEAILLAQALKDWLMTDLGSQRVIQSAKYLIVQQWVLERGIEGLTPREREIYRDPARYDLPIVQAIAVSAGKGATQVVVTWDLPLEVWADLGREVTGVVADAGRTFAIARRRSLRFVVRFRDAEVLRIAANPEGVTETIFSYR